MDTSLSTRILPDLYGCCEHSSNWRPVLDQICAGLGVRSAAVQIFGREGASLSRRWQERDSYSHAHAAQHDRWINNAENPRLVFDTAGSPFSPVNVLTDDRRFVPGSPQLIEIRRRLGHVGLRGGTGILFEFAPSRYFSLILHRQIDDPAEMDRKDAAFLQEIGPHLFSLSRVLARLHAACGAEATLTSIMDQLRVGIILCASTGEVRWRNRAANLMIFDGAPLSIGSGRLRGHSTDSRQRLDRLLSPSCPGDMTTTCFRQRDGGTLQVVAVPAGEIGGIGGGGWADDKDGRALILIDPTQAPPLSAEHVMSLFGLTPAEAQLSVALSLGTSLAEYAEIRGISVGTVRIQMKRILGKTDSRRQADLVGKIYGSVIAQVHDRLH